MFKADACAGKVALVTGASRGIGKAIAAALSQVGATVIGTATTESGAEAITQALQIQSANSFGLQLDVTNQASIDIALETIKSRVGSVNILVNNAAITKDNLFLRMKTEEWLQVIDADLNSVYRMSKACIKDMLKARFGRIINIGSVVGNMGNPGQANYCAAKAGIIGLSKSLAIELGSRNITVNTIAPGFIKTDMTDALTEDQQQNIFSRIPMQKFGSLQAIADAVIYLAAPTGDYITGQTLHINGGLYMN